jgi:TolA-binding protein
MTNSQRVSHRSLIALILLGSTLTACATAPVEKPSETPAAGSAEAQAEGKSAAQLTTGATQPKTPPLQPQRVKELEDKIRVLTLRLEEMESKVMAMHDKIDETRAGVETLSLASKGQIIPATVTVLPHPVDRSRSAGVAVPESRVRTEVGSAYVQSEAVQSYRKAMILLETKKLREAILQFGLFLEEQPDHILAGSAQYHIGECYYLLDEPKLAAQELQRVLTTYDRSPFVADTHRLLAEIHRKLNDSAKANHHEQILARYYTQSPAAKEVMNPALQRKKLESGHSPSTETAGLAHPETTGLAHPETAGLAHPETTGLAHPETTGLAHPETTGLAQPNPNEAGLQNSSTGLDAPPETVVSGVPTAPSGLDAATQNPPEHTGTVAPTSTGEHSHP